jgi:hypothetical protein
LSPFPFPPFLFTLPSPLPSREGEWLINGNKERLQKEYKNPPGAIVRAPSENFHHFLQKVKG